MEKNDMVIAVPPDGGDHRQATLPAGGLQGNERLPKLHTGQQAARRELSVEVHSERSVDVWTCRSRLHSGR